MTRTLALPELVEAPPESDPFCYGVRMVQRRQPDGSFQMLRMPLTLWDVLHPQEGDHIVQSLRHLKEVRYLSSALEAHVADDPHALVTSDLAIHWDIPGLSYHCPDVAVIFNVREVQEQYSSFLVTFEGVRPALIIEVVSPQTRDVRQVDTVTKLIEYHAAMVPLYVIIDREREDDWPVIRAYRYKPLAYEPIALDDQDCLLLEDLGLRLCANQNRITLYNAITGKELGDYTAISQALEAEAAARQAAEEDARLANERAEAEAEARRLAEEQARLAAEAQQQAEEQARLAAEAQRQAEEQARTAAEARRQAEEQARTATEARRLAEEQARTAADAQRLAEEQARASAAARAELERQLRELQARFLSPPDAGATPDLLPFDL